MAADDSGVQTALGASLAARLRGRAPVVLDGATGTELERRGARSDLPLWSSWALLEAPELLRRIHADYLGAGVDALTAATFRTHARSLAAAGLEARAGELTAAAVRLAREAAERADRETLVLGSAAPLEDCYHPERVPGADALAREHAQHARNLFRAGVDAILVETMNSAREAAAAAEAARAAGAELLVSFVCGPAARLLSGEPLAEALDAVRAFAPAAVGVNCLAPAAVDACLPVLRRADAPFLVYPNLVAGSAHAEPEAFAEAALRFATAGAAGLGGCCGTTPAHLAALARRLRRHGGDPRPAAQ
jgi:S-methylmethionine-dependent homocysteine/selenocysteine methylase